VGGRQLPKVLGAVIYGMSYFNHDLLPRYWLKHDFSDECGVWFDQATKQPHDIEVRDLGMHEVGDSAGVDTDLSDAPSPQTLPKETKLGNDRIDDYRMAFRNVKWTTVKKKPRILFGTACTDPPFIMEELLSDSENDSIDVLVPDHLEGTESEDETQNARAGISKRNHKQSFECYSSDSDNDSLDDVDPTARRLRRRVRGPRDKRGSLIF
jgi:hypothetical protein